MTRKYADLATPPATPQSQPLDARQVRNNAGGFVYAIDDWKRLERFLVLGSDAPTYYQSPRQLTRENAACVERCYAADPERTVATLAAVSDAGRAPRNDATIFALAMGAAHADPAVRRMALAALPKVCRTSTHLFQLIGAARALGKGWGRGLKTAVAGWYDARTADQLAYQMIKYRSREAMTHRRVLQTAHPSAGDDAGKLALYRWARELAHEADALPALVRAHLAAMQLKAEGAERASLIRLIRKHKLPWEAIPTEVRTDPEVWKAMIPDMGLTALIRNLGVMTACGALTPLSRPVEQVVARLADGDALQRARVHPFSLLQALAVYRSGAGVRGALSWQPVGEVLEALDAAFYSAFAHVEPTGKRMLLALDVSGSMGTPLRGSPLTCREAAAAMAMVAARTERRHHVVAFTGPGHGVLRADTTITPLGVSPSMRLDEVVRITSGLAFGTTDCALPMLHALEERLEVDTFVVYTDNETWAGAVHPMAALRRYRERTGIAARLIVVAMTSTGFSIADPADGGALDIVGFDSACPTLMADFGRG